MILRKKQRISIFLARFASLIGRASRSVAPAKLTQVSAIGAELNRRRKINILYFLLWKIECLPICYIDTGKFVINKKVM